jgi:uncharacterized membrane protein YccC
MLAWARRLPAYALNGLSVSLGVGFVQLVFGVVASADFAQAASTGAVLASLPHLTGRAGPTLRRTLVGGLLAALATFVVVGTTEHFVLRGAVIALISFVSLLAMAWGTREAPLVFSVLIGVVFSLARPSSDGAVGLAFASACGVGLYAGWALVNAKLLEPRYRALAVFDALDAAAALLRARAGVLSQAHDEPEGEAAGRFVQLNEEVRLAQSLQTARDLAYPAVGRAGGALQVAMLSRVAELREIVLTSRLDLDLLGHDHAARFIRARLALGLRKLSETLQQLALAEQQGVTVTRQNLRALPALPDMLEAATLLVGHDPRARLLPVVASRLRYLAEEVAAIRALLLGEAARPSLSPAELTHYVADDDTWPLHVVVEHLSLSSPVLRHALRSALAFSSVYFLAYALPWTTRPYWMLLSVVVVLRGTLDDTLSRRNARVSGTAIGCLGVTLLVPLAPDALLKLVFVAAVGVAHAFVNVRYLLTAISATVMALLQAHFAAPEAAPLVAERLLDTVLGALFAWAFSYVLPSWERRTLPAAVERTLLALRQYSQTVLVAAGPARAEQRLARQRAYDALAVVAAALRRSAAEPKRVRPPVQELVGVLDHAQRLMAHLSSLRSLLERRGALLPSGETYTALAVARQTIDEQLSLAAPARAMRPREPSHAELPGTPVEHEPLPWLLRRLDASVHDAGEAGTAARQALLRLARSPTTPATEPEASKF